MRSAFILLATFLSNDVPSLFDQERVGIATAQMFPARWQFAHAPGLPTVRPTVLAVSYSGQLVIEVNLVPEFMPRPPPEKNAVAHAEIGGNVAGRVPFGNRFPRPSSFTDKRTGPLGLDTLRTASNFVLTGEVTISNACSSDG